MHVNLTCDNPPLQRLTKSTCEVAQSFAINCINTAPKTVAEYINESLSQNTRIAYLSDLAHFKGWGGRIPANPEIIAEYLASHADILSVATLNRRVAALAKVHRSCGFSNPTTSGLVKSTLRGIQRIKGKAQRQAKALIKEDLFQILEATGQSLKDVRDRALLLVGFAGGFRRSELVSLTYGDVEFVRRGIIINIRRSKTDQAGNGRKIGIPHAKGRWCPVEALEQWISTSNFSEGALFRPIDRHHRIGVRQLSGEAVCLIVKKRVQLAGIDPSNYSGHSLRAGFATSAAQAGVASWKIRQQTGHASEAMLARYIREGELFVNNAAGALL